MHKYYTKHYECFFLKGKKIKFEHAIILLPDIETQAFNIE